MKCTTLHTVTGQVRTTIFIIYQSLSFYVTIVIVDRHTHAYTYVHIDHSNKRHFKPLTNMCPLLDVLD